MQQILSIKYQQHKIFQQLSDYANFYQSLSESVMNWITGGVKSVLNLDTYVFSSMQGTLESIQCTLQKGRINDSYALLRKFYDSTVINIYSNLYLQDHRTLENIIVKQIDGWRDGTVRMPEFKIMVKYIVNSPILKGVTDLLLKDDTYKIIRTRCNDHTHYNYYKYVILNDNQIFSPARVNMLNIFSDDLESIIIQHLACIFMINDHYMTSSDYVDSLEIGIPAEEGSQYWVAPFVQQVFDKLIKVKRPDVADALKAVTNMKLS